MPHYRNPEEALVAVYGQLDAWLHAQLRDATRSALYGRFSYQRMALVQQGILKRIQRDHGILTRREVTAVTQWFEEQSRLTETQLSEIAQKHGVPFTPRDTAQWIETNEHAIATIAEDLANRRAQFLGIIPNASTGMYGGVLRQIDDYLRTIAAGELPKALLGVQGTYQTGMAIREQGINLLRNKTALQHLAKELDGCLGVVYRDGTRHSLHAYGQMAARTGLARAKTEASYTRMNDAGIPCFQVSSHGSLCPVCRPYEGTVWALNVAGEALGYRRCPVTWPRHPHCGHSCMPYDPRYMKGAARFPDELVGADTAAHREWMQEHHPDLMGAAKQGFATEHQWNEAISGLPDVAKDQLRGPRWRYAGIESRRMNATAEMLQSKGLAYKEAMSRQTQQFMRSTSYLQDRAKAGIFSPSKQRKLLREMRQGRQRD